MSEEHCKMLQSLLDGSPFHGFMKMQVLEFDAGQQQIRILLPYRHEFERIPNTGQIHGGVIAALTDIAGDFALIGLLKRGIPTIDLRIDYLRAAANTDLTALATVRRSGRTVGVVDIEVSDEQGRLIALGRGCYGTSAPAT